MPDGATPTGSRSSAAACPSSGPNLSVRSPITPVSFAPALAIAATFPPARAQASFDQFYLARVAAPMYALTDLIGGDNSQPF